MKRVCLAIWALIFLASSSSGVHAAKYAGEFLRLGVGARAWALGGAYVASNADATAAYWNPANLTGLTERSLLMMHSETFGSLLNYDAVAFGLPSPNRKRPLVFGFTILRLGGGGIQRTALANPNLPISDSNRVVRVGETVGHADWALIGGVGTRIRDDFDAGVSAKLIYRDLVDVSGFGIGLDLGASYRPHPWWRAALVLYDATSTLLAYDNGNKESIIPHAAVGLAFNPRWERLALTLTADAVMEFEDRRLAAQFYQAPISTDLRWGAEIVYRNHLALRGGMDAENPTLGVGVTFRRISIDGAWRSHDTLDDSYRFSLSYGW